jgi:uncharacterized membrane protein (UPF0127 family)
MVWLTRCLVFVLSIFILSANVFAQTKENPPKFEKKEITVGKKNLSVEVAKTEEQHSYGLMFRDKLPDNYGMMFVFPSSEPRSFWMKNTFVDLSIGYFDANKVLFQVVDMKATNMMQKQFPSYESSGPAEFALEVPKGWFQKNNVKIGDKFIWR